MLVGLFESEKGNAAAAELVVDDVELVVLVLDVVVEVEVVVVEVDEEEDLDEVVVVVVLELLGVIADELEVDIADVLELAAGDADPIAR